MKFKNLYFKNFKNLKEVILPVLDNRIVLIVGDTGEGKSAIFEGIRYLMTDTLPKDTKISDYIRNGQEKFEIGCEFEHFGINYQLNIIGHKSATKNLIVSNESESFTGSDATNKLKEIIKPKLALYSAISIQGKTSQLLFESPATKLQNIKEILGIDRIGFVTSEMKNEQDKNKEKLTVLNAELPLLENKEFTYYEIEELEDITELKQEFEVLETKKSLYEERSKIYDSYLEKKENYEKAQENIKNLDKDIKDNTNELNDLELKDLPDYDSDKYSNLKIELNDVETNISNWYNKKEQALKVEKEINKLNSELNEIKSSLEKNRLFRVKTLSFTDDEFKKVENQLDYDKIEMHKYTDGANAIHKAECPILEQPCDRIKDEYERFIEERDKYNDKVNKGIKQLEQWKKDKEEYNNSKNNLDKIKIKRDQLLKDKEDKFSRLNELTKTEIVVDEKNLNELTDKKCKIEIDLDKLDKLKIEYDTIKSYNSNLVELRLRKELDIAQLEGQVKELEKIEEPEEIKPPEEFNLNKYETVKKEINIYDQKIIEIEKLNKMNEETKEKEKQNKKDIKDKKKKIENLEKRNRALEQARTFLDKKFSAYMVTKGTTKIKNKMNEFFQGAYGKYEVTFMQDKNSVEFFYTENGQYPKSVVMSSGHEKKVLAVSNRIALCSLQSLGIMLLDEIDSDCNTDKSIKLFDKLLNEKFNQLFIITHNYETQEFIRNQWGCGLFEIKQGTII